MELEGEANTDKQNNTNKQRREIKRKQKHFLQNMFLITSFMKMKN